MLLNSSKTKQIVFDMFINLLGTGISLVILQLFIYPIAAQNIDADSYGEMQSVMSLVYLVGGTLGGALSTTRLVREYEYQEKKISADFNLLFIFCFFIIILFLPFFLYLYLENVEPFSIFLIIVIALLNYAVNYFNVGLRLNLDYKAIFIDKILASIGYGIGFVLFYYTLTWQYIFICSGLIEIGYLLVKTNLAAEPYKKSILCVSTAKSFGNLSIANLLTKALTYFDKLILYPLLGGEEVSIYFAANVFGKLMLQTMEPVTNVLLSYLSRKKRISGSLWKTVIPISIVICFVLYVLCVLISKPVLTIFYPQWVNEAYKLIPLATLSLAISSFIQILYPFTLKAVETSRQIVINAGGLGIYIISVILLYRRAGLVGCCVALLISYITKLILMFYFCFKEKSGNEK